METTLNEFFCPVSLLSVTMRKKTTPVPRTSKRQRTSTVQLWRRPATDRWALAEWFMPFLDAPFFTYSEFQHMIATAMSLSKHRNRATYLQFSRIRSAMCNTIPGRFVRPRRLSNSFLDAERKELIMYRADARRVLRGLDLLPARDPITMTPLPPHWWTRYRCPPPEKPSPETPVFVRVVKKPRQSIDLMKSTLPPIDTHTIDIPSSAMIPASSVPIPSTSAKTSGPPTPGIPTSGMITAQLMPSNSTSANTTVPLRPSIPTSLIIPPPPMPPPLPPSTQYSEVVGQIDIRRAMFLAFDGESRAIVRFIDDGFEQTVSDLDVMLCQNVTPFTPPPPQQNAGHSSPSFSGFEFTPTTPLFDFQGLDSSSVGEDLLALSNFFASPSTSLQSPLRLVSGEATSNGPVECEVDVRGIAHSMRLLDLKAQLLYKLRTCNAAAEREQTRPIRSEISQRYDSILSELANVNHELCLALTPETSVVPVVERLDFSSPMPELSTLHARSPHSLMIPYIQEDGFEQRLQDLAEEQELLPPSAGPTSMAASTQVAGPSTAVTMGTSAIAPLTTSSMELSSVAMPQPAATTAVGASAPDPAIDSNLSTSGGDVYSVDFHSPTGAAILAKALTRAAFAKLHEDSALKLAPGDVRADVLECVSTCVSMLIRARLAGDSGSIISAAEQISLRAANNAEALEAVFEAARAFDTVGNTDASKTTDQLS